MKKACHLAIALIALCVALASCSLAVTRYTLTDLTGPVGAHGSSSASGINNYGQCTGSYYGYGFYGGFYGAFFYDGTMHPIGSTTGQVDSYAWEINNKGQVVGDVSYDPDHARAFFYDGAMHDLGTLGGNESYAYDLNDAGTVIGASLLAGDEVWRAFAYYDGSMHDIGTLGGEMSDARGINNSGQIVGQADINVDSQDYHAFLYDGEMHDLGTLGGRYSQADAINDLGQVVGLSETSEGLWIDHAFFYDGTTMHDLGTLGGHTSRAEDINNSGIVVGQSDAAGSSGWRAFVYDGTAMYDLNDLIVPGSEWTLCDAGGINDRGQIVAIGNNELGEYRSFLLTPVPEPSCLATVLCGLCGVLAIRRRRG